MRDHEGAGVKVVPAGAFDVSKQPDSTFAEARCAAMCDAEAARCTAAMRGAGITRRKSLRQQRGVAIRLATQMRQAACPAPAFGPYVARMAANIGNDFMQMELVGMLRNLLAARELLGYELAEARGRCDPAVVEEKIRAFTPPPRALAAAQRGLTEEQLDGVRGFQTMVALAALGHDLDVERLAVMIGCPWNEAEALLAPYAAASEVRDVP